MSNVKSVLLARNLVDSEMTPMQVCNFEYELDEWNIDYFLGGISSCLRTYDSYCFLK